MSTQEMIDRYAAAFKARTRDRTGAKKPPHVGHFGTLGPVFLPPELVDDMEVAIDEAFEHIEAEQVETDDCSIG